MYWIYSFIPGCVATLLIGKYLREAFRAENMIEVDGFHKKYQLFDRYGNEVLAPLPKGVRLSTYTILTSLVVLVFTITAIFVGDNWWLPLVIYVGCELICHVLSALIEFSYKSFLYYLLLIISPVLLIVSFVMLFN